MEIKKGIYYNLLQDNFMIVTKSELMGFYNKSTNEFYHESVVDFVFYRDDENSVKTIKRVTLSNTDNMIFICEY